VGATARVEVWASLVVTFVHLTPVRNARDADELRRVADDVHHSPVADPDAATDLCSLSAFCIPWAVVLPRDSFCRQRGPARCPVTLRVPSVRTALPQRNSYSTHATALYQVRLILSSGIPFSLRRDSEISPVPKIL